MYSTCNESGKGQPLDTMIPTPTGWRRLGDLAIGDKLFASDGSFCRVEAIFDRGERDVYRFEFDDGRVSTECDGDHLWIHKTPKQRFRKGQEGWSVASTMEIIRDHGMEPPPTDRISIPKCGPVQMRESQHVVHPYVIGLLIGDGSFPTVKGANVALSCADIEIIGRVRELLWPSGMRLGDKINYDYRIISDRGSLFVGASMQSESDRLGLRGKDSYSKFIPDEYMIDSVGNRIELLRGLMDSDGTITAKTNGSSYTTTSYRLATQVAELVHSLGGFASIRGPFTKKFRYKGELKTGAPCWTVAIRMSSICPFWCSRKTSRWSESSRWSDRVLHRIVPAGRKATRCIRVSSPDHSYLTNDYIVTHNTSTLGPLFLLSWMAAFPGCRAFATSASERQVMSQLLQTNILPIISQWPATWKYLKSEGLITHANGSSCRFYVCDDPNNVEGFHSGHQRMADGTLRFLPCVYLVDEAKGVKAEVHDRIRRINPYALLAMSSPGELNSWHAQAIDIDNYTEPAKT